MPRRKSAAARSSSRRRTAPAVSAEARLSVSLTPTAPARGSYVGRESGEGSAPAEASRSQSSCATAPDAPGFPSGVFGPHEGARTSARGGRRWPPPQWRLWRRWTRPGARANVTPLCITRWRRASPRYLGIPLAAEAAEDRPAPAATRPLDPRRERPALLARPELRGRPEGGVGGLPRPPPSQRLRGSPGLESARSRRAGRPRSSSPAPRPSRRTSGRPSGQPRSPRPAARSLSGPRRRGRGSGRPRRGRRRGCSSAATSAAPTAPPRGRRRPPPHGADSTASSSATSSSVSPSASSKRTGLRSSSNSRSSVSARSRSPAVASSARAIASSALLRRSRSILDGLPDLLPERRP